MGNGFDIAHNLPTTYTDFRDFLERSQHHGFIDIFERFSLSAHQELWSQFEENLGKLDGTAIQDEAFHTRNEFNDGFDYDLGNDCHIISFLENKYYSDLSNLDEYVQQWVSEIDLHVTKAINDFKSLIDETSVIITFNYTLTLEEIYKISSTRIMHLHGSVKDQPIMGHGADTDGLCDNFLSSSYEDPDPLVEQFMTTFRQLFNNFYLSSTKNVEEFKKNLKNFILSQPTRIERILVFGHSLGKPDRPYFEEILRLLPMAVWVIFYYTEQDLESMKAGLRNLDLKKCQFLSASYLPIFVNENTFSLKT